MSDGYKQKTIYGDKWVSNKESSDAEILTIMLGTIFIIICLICQIKA